MKKVIMTLAILAFFAAGANACEPYTALLLSENEDPTAASMEVSPAPYEEVALRLWMYNDVVKGLTGFELGMDFGPAMYMNATVNPGVPAIIGDVLTCNFAGAFQLCQMDEYVWLVKYTFPYTGDPHMVSTVTNCDTGNYIVTSCETDYPKYPITEGNQFGVNMSAVVDSETESWGAVKSMYR
ncbi:MAG: hypothetical protein R6U43_09765 [Candidatus Krumholzibacteriales bacterium]